MCKVIKENMNLIGVYAECIQWPKIIIQRFKKTTSNEKTLDGANCRLNTKETIGEFENSNNNSR